MIFTESSTLARGLIVDVNPKPMDYDKFSKLEELSKKISGITPFLIQSLMNDYSKESIIEIFKRCRKEVTNFNLMEFGISIDNYSRSINNAAALFTSWKIFSNILFNQEAVGEKYQEIFPKLLKNALLKNLSRVNTYRQDRLFEYLLWESIQNRKLKLKQYDSSGAEINEYGKRETVGAYTITRDKNIEVVISLKSALRDIKRIAPELNITEETLINKLVSEKKIYTNNAHKHRVAGHNINGVLWVGEIPKSVFDINENDPVELTNEILEEENKRKTIQESLVQPVITTEKLEVVDCDCPVYDLNELQKEVDENKKKQYPEQVSPYAYEWPKVNTYCGNKKS